MPTLTPILTATPGNPLTYNVGIAETFSWVPVENDADRPIYARATYLTNASDISVSLSAGNLNVSLDGVEQSLDNVEALLNQLTANTDTLEVNTDGVELLLSSTNTLLNSLTSTNQQISTNSSNSVTLLNELTSSNIHVPGFSIPPYDEINLNYVGSTEYLSKVSYLNNTTEVLALSFVYVTEPPTSTDNRISKVIKL